MLVLTRKTTETIQIGDNVVIKVIDCGRGRVKIGIDAPTSVRVVRGELVESAIIKRVAAVTADLHRPSPAPVA